MSLLWSSNRPTNWFLIDEQPILESWIPADAKLPHLWGFWAVPHKSQEQYSFKCSPKKQKWSDSTSMFSRHGRILSIRPCRYGIYCMYYGRKLCCLVLDRTLWQLSRPRRSRRSLWSAKSSFWEVAQSRGLLPALSKVSVGTIRLAMTVSSGGCLLKLDWARFVRSDQEVLKMVSA